MSARKRPVESMKTDMWVTVNLPSPGIELHDVVRRRMPFTLFQSLAEMWGMAEGILSEHMAISYERLSKAMTAGFFSVWESRRLYGLIVALQACCELFEGDVQAAMSFLQSPLRCFDSKTPLETLVTEEGRSAVIDLIGRLEHGIPT
ncbi:antitoxin Xre/MbcA/ParS toxin-binding domain-containing protein [Pseudomonas sp. MWU318]|uniref:antitoxin Xre/MbcA/ParS toxin-binding domain-containing protein n=1 Tax=Pseudomonas sp. MWU318 TaxID=2802569 RepID=UPI001926C95A|nr:antitoxin Xre/MbcA/ParS toxin-binding domain-containing protein [Pseudomonas sp. MWU318]